MADAVRGPLAALTSARLFGIGLEWKPARICRSPSFSCVSRCCRVQRGAVLTWTGDLVQAWAEACSGRVCGNIWPACHRRYRMKLQASADFSQFKMIDLYSDCCSLDGLEELYRNPEPDLCVSRKGKLLTDRSLEQDQAYRPSCWWLLGKGGEVGGRTERGKYQTFMQIICYTEGAELKLRGSAGECVTMGSTLLLERYREKQKTTWEAGFNSKSMYIFWVWYESLQRMVQQFLADLFSNNGSPGGAPATL